MIKTLVSINTINCILEMEGNPKHVIPCYQFLWLRTQELILQGYALWKRDMFVQQKIFVVLTFL